MNHRTLWSMALALGSPATGQTTPADIVEMSDISGLSASPDGRWIAYRVERPSIARNAIDTRWQVVAADGSEPARDAGSGGRALSNGAGIVENGKAQWSPDSQSFYARALIDGAIGIWQYAIDGTAPRAVVAGDANVVRFAPIGERAIVYETGPSRDAIVRAENAGRDSGVLMDERVDLAQGVYRGGIVDGRTASERWSGQWFAREPLLASVPRTARVHDLATGDDRTATPRDRLHLAAALPAFPSSAAALLDKADDDLSVVSHVALRDGRWVVTLQDDAIGQQLWIVDTARTHARLLRTSAGLLNGGRNESSPCAAAARALVCVEASPNVPPRLVRLPLAGGSVQVLDAPNANLTGDGLRAEPLAWKVGDRGATGWLIRPVTPGPHPLFVTYYRCSGYLRGGLGDEWPLFALANAGIAALCINALPIAGPNPETRYNSGLAAVRAAIAMLERRGAVDPGRVGMGGLSFGSEVAMWIAGHSDLLAAVSIASVQIEPTYYWFNSIADRGRFGLNFERYWNLGAPADTRAGWERLSPARYSERLDIPVLLQLPEQEARLSPELHAKLIDARLGELHVFPLSPHIKIAPRQKLAAYRRNLDWFRFWLLGDVDSDPAKAAQYARWRELAR